VEVAVTVKNVGPRAGDEVVQMYVQHLGSTVERPQLELKGFERVHLDAGETKELHLELKARDLAFWDTTGHVWRVEKEPIRVLAGGSSDKLPVQATLQINTIGDFKP